MTPGDGDLRTAVAAVRRGGGLLCGGGRVRRVHAVNQKKTVPLLLSRYLRFLLTDLYNFFTVPIGNYQRIYTWYKICHLSLVALLHYLEK